MLETTHRYNKKLDAVSPLRFLIIEDEDDAILLLRQLQSAGLIFDCKIIDDEQALLVALQESWDVVFSEYTLSSFSGVHALEIVRQHDQHLPFIFVAGTVAEEAAVKALKDGAQDFIMKDNPVRLITSVKRELFHAEMRQKYRHMENEHTQLLTILEATPDPVAIFEASGALRYLSTSWRRLYTLELNENIGRYKIDDLFPEGMSLKLDKEILPAVQRDGRWKGNGFLNTDSGRKMPVSLTILPHLNPASAADQLYIIARDISESTRLETGLDYKATHDSLTGLPNRLSLSSHFDTELRRARTHDRNVGVLFLDLNNFKRINDSLGYPAGDTLLQEVARCLRACVRPNDIIARIGGDEFVILLGNLDLPENMNSLLHRIRADFEKSIIVSSQEVFITFSAGIALYPQHGDRVEVLLRHAETAMYHAKNFGSNQYCVYSPDMRTRAQGLLSLEAELKHALNRNELILHFQPQINLRNGQINNAEALLRWHNSVRGLIPTDTFIPLLESTGMIISIGEWVLHQASTTLRSWHEAGFEKCRIAVNVSALQFNDNHFFDKVRDAVIEGKISPHELELEITENIIMSDLQKAAEIIEALLGYGIRIAIDDYGTGYSSLTYLKRFSPHALKIDQTFITDLMVEKNDAAIVESSIILGHKLGLEVIAEGVETTDQFNFLRNSGCDSAQGFYFSRPLLAADFIGLLQEQTVDKVTENQH